MFSKDFNGSHTVKKSDFLTLCSKHELLNECDANFIFEQLDYMKLG